LRLTSFLSWQPIIEKILALKFERAQLLGKRHHADVSTASKMATFEGAMKYESYEAVIFFHTVNF